MTEQQAMKIEEWAAWLLILALIIVVLAGWWRGRERDRVIIFTHGADGVDGSMVRVHSVPKVYPPDHIAGAGKKILPSPNIPCEVGVDPACSATFTVNGKRVNYDDWRRAEMFD